MLRGLPRQIHNTFTRLAEPCPNHDSLSYYVIMCDEWGSVTEYPLPINTTFYGMYRTYEEAYDEIQDLLQAKIKEMELERMSMKDMEPLIWRPFEAVISSVPVWQAVSDCGDGASWRIQKREILCRCVGYRETADIFQRPLIP